MTNTPLVKLDNCYLKREDQNITGSAKDRAIIYQIDNLKKNNFTQAVISSTGNAAISAAHFCYQNKIELIIFLSTKVNPKKLNILKQYPSEIILSQKPISDAIKFAKKNKAYLLRQSTDPIAIIGYQQIAQEIIKQLPKITSVFIPIGSGTTLLGISQKLPPSVKIFGAQSVANCPISKSFDKNYNPEIRLITDALSAKFIPQKNKIITAIKKSNGFSFAIQNEAIISATHFLESKNIITSLESSLAFAAFQKAQKNNFDTGKFPVILLTGAKR
ncbi:MAG: PLP-dependent lyase/thiolase [Candidatus Shapirobacteria bacterium]|nr:PLP-dependent lyase/thiolase [Candidatus Shapirobacteria bacterium]